MNKSIIIFFILFLSLLLNCKNKSPTETPPDNNIHPQVDIPWPSLGDSQWPMHHHDPQSTGRSPFVGPQQGEVAWKFSVDGPVGTSVAIAHLTPQFISPAVTIPLMETRVVTYTL